MCTSHLPGDRAERRHEVIGGLHHHQLLVGWLDVRVAEQFPRVRSETHAIRTPPTYIAVPSYRPKPCGQSRFSPVTVTMASTGTLDAGPILSPRAVESSRFRQRRITATP